MMFLVEPTDYKYDARLIFRTHGQKATLFILSRNSFHSIGGSVDLSANRVARNNCEKSECHAEYRVGNKGKICSLSQQDDVFNCKSTECGEAAADPRGKK